MTGSRVVATVVIVVFATAVVPPVAAFVVNQRRIRRAEADIAVIAERLRLAEPNLRRLAGAVEVLCGPGRVPVAAAAAGRWVTAPRGALAAVFPDRPLPAIDPWGNCYALNLAAVTAGEPAIVWVLSAGPDGVIETAFISNDATPAGNDVRIRVR